MQRIADFILEACFLKHIPRSGYQYLGAGQESVAEHVYSTIMIAYVLAQLEPLAEVQRLISMCLMHDLCEARMGDLNYVQKRYVQADESRAAQDALQGLAFGPEIANLIDEFNTGRTLEAQLAHDADQLALAVDLKSLADIGYQTPQTWLPHVEKRLKTAVGKQLAKAVAATPWDGWWQKIFVDSNNVLS